MYILYVQLYCNSPRCRFSVYHVRCYYVSTDERPLGGLVPSLPVVVALLISFIVTATSEVRHTLINSLNCCYKLLIVYFSCAFNRLFCLSEFLIVCDFLFAIAGFVGFLGSLVASRAACTGGRSVWRVAAGCCLSRGTQTSRICYT